MTIIKALQCGIDGCKTSKLKRHTHTLGDLRNFGDRKLIEQYRIFAEMRGEPVQIPGGDAKDMSHYMTKQVKSWDKDAKEFRDQIAKEYKELVKKHGKKPGRATEQEAEANVRKLPKWRKWKK